MRPIIFLSFSVLVLLYAAARGGAPERMGAAILAFDFQGSMWLVSAAGHRFEHFETLVFLLDLTAFGLLYAICIVTSRFWPYWLAGVQGVVTLSHLSVFSPLMLKGVSGSSVALWGYVLLGLLAVATYRHRNRLTRFGIDPAWYWQLPTSYLAGGAADEARSNPASQNSAGKS